MAVSVGAMLVVILIIVVSFAHSSCGGTNEEELLPYSPDEGWGPQYRTSEELLRRMNDVEADVARREEGDDQMTARYNTTHDIFLPPSSAQDSTVGPANSTSSFVEHRRLTQRMADGSTLFGNVYFISDPHNHFSIQPPDGGCGRRMTVSQTAIRKKCLVASNAGFFVTRTGACLGNIVSDGVVLQNSGRQNANFGLMKDGSLVAGYVTSAEVGQGLDTKWVQLVAGVVWLVRNGQNYVNQSALIEDLSVQETGSAFITVKSARNSIGYDHQGRLMLVLIDGKTGLRGVNLHQFADILVSLGAKSAINLDGGGSAQMVENGAVVNYPSDECSDNPRFTCERPITSIVCVRP